jgi:hypothetical protein
MYIDKFFIKLKENVLILGIHNECTLGDIESELIFEDKSISVQYLPQR